jgi:hypothetical protein
MAHGQRDSLFFPGEYAHFGLGREHRALHDDGVWMRAGPRTIACDGEDEVGLRVEQPAGDSLKLDVRCRDSRLSGMGRRRLLTAGSTTSDLPMRVRCLVTRCPACGSSWLSFIL